MTIGNFDGVHVGHQHILKRLVSAAAKKNLKSVVLTFSPHPIQFLVPQIAPKLISTIEQKLELLFSFEVDCVVLQKFDATFAKISPEDFFKIHLLRNLSTRFIKVGHDFTFGEKRRGTTETLEHLAKKNQVDVSIISAQMVDNMLVSSTLVRKLIASGELSMAGKLLGRAFFIDGNVVRGQQRGGSLGIHTANLTTQNELLPADGVYATVIEVNGKKWQGATNIGFNPTFGNTARSIEAHLFDFDGDLYGQNLRVHFMQKLRDETKFASPEALVKQIVKDIVLAKRILD